MTAVYSDLPHFLLDLIACPPNAGEGVHSWLFKVSRHLHAHRNEEDIFLLLQAALEGCGRFVPDREIQAAVVNSKKVAWRPGKTGDSVYVARATWPKPDLDAIRSIVAQDWGLYDLWEKSPVRFDDGERHAEEIIDVLFPGNPLLCCGLTAYQFATRRRETWRDHLADYAFIVPNPMYKVQGLTRTGGWSEHCKSATAARVYLVIEFDFSEFARDGKTLSQWAPLVREWRTADVAVADACAAVHLHLATRLPLVAAVHSGGKSLHGWYSAFNQTDLQLRPFMEYAVSLGADPMLWTRSQFSRIPDGTRADGKAQTCFYLDSQKAVRQ